MEASHCGPSFYIQLFNIMRLIRVYCIPIVLGDFSDCLQGAFFGITIGNDAPEQGLTGKHHAKINQFAAKLRLGK